MEKEMAELKNIRIAVSGLYDYAFEELPTLRIPLPGRGAPEWVEEKRLYKVYRPAPVLAAACKKFASLPLTHHHPKTPVDGQNFRNIAIGWTGESPEVDYIAETDEVGIKSTCVLYDDEALQAYENGEVQLSPGYIAVFEWQKGQTPRGEEYDIIMKEITDVNHLALLPAGRGGEYAVVLDNAPEGSGEKTVFDIVRKNHENVSKDGAPKGNDNASKDHVKQEEDGLNEEEKTHLHNVLKENAVKFPAVPFSEENYKKYLGSPIETPQGKVKLGENQFEKLKKKNRQDLIGAIHDTLSNPCFIAEEKGGTTLYVKSFIKNDEQKNIMSVVIKRDGLNISISTHEERETQILSKIKKAGVLMETASDDGTVRDKSVADTTRVVSLTITDEPPKSKTVFEICHRSVFDLVHCETYDVKYEDGHVSHRANGDYIKQGGKWHPIKKDSNSKDTEPLFTKIQKLERIPVNPKWAYQPDEKTDLKDMVKNPIPFVGEGNDWKIGEAIENAKQPDYKSNVAIDIASLKTLQPFVLKSGLENYKSWDNSERPYVVNYKGENYLIDGNHRVALAKLKGEKTINVDISVRV